MNGEFLGGASILQYNGIAHTDIFCQRLFCGCLFMFLANELTPLGVCAFGVIGNEFEERDIPHPHKCGGIPASFRSTRYGSRFFDHRVPPKRLVLCDLPAR